MRTELTWAPANAGQGHGLLFNVPGGLGPK
jgi:hypothetical protein